MPTRPSAVPQSDKDVPRIVLEWARHHVDAFIADDDVEEVRFESDYDGRPLTAITRRGLHEEARRRGLKARSVDLDGNGGERGVVVWRRGRSGTHDDEDDEDVAERRRVTSTTAAGAPTAGGKRLKTGDNVDDSDEDEDTQRWAEMCGYEDMRGAPFDLYAELKIAKRENGEYAGGATRARACYHRESAKWHPDNLFTTRSRDASTFSNRCGFCDECQCVLRFGRWYRSNEEGEFGGRDYCSTCVSISKRVIPGREWDKQRNTGPLVVEGEHIVIQTMDDLGEDRGTYESQIDRGSTKAAAACRKLQRLGVAFIVFKDAEKFRIYREHGYEGLVKAEKFAENDVFDLDGFSIYDAFFAGEDEEDRQYLLLCPEAESDDEMEANVDAMHVSTRSNDSGSDDDEDEDPDDEVEAMLARERALLEESRLQRKPVGDNAVNSADDFPLPPLAVRTAACEAANAMKNDRNASLAIDGDVWTEMSSRLNAQNS